VLEIAIPNYFCATRHPRSDVRISRAPHRSENVPRFSRCLATLAGGQRRQGPRPGRRPRIGITLRATFARLPRSVAIFLPAEVGVSRSSRAAGHEWLPAPGGPLRALEMLSVLGLRRFRHPTNRGESAGDRRSQTRRELDAFVETSPRRVRTSTRARLDSQEDRHARTGFPTVCWSGGTPTSRS